MLVFILWVAGHLKTEKVMIGKTKVRWPHLRHRECMVFPWIKVFLGGENCICPTLNNRHTPRDTQPSVGWGWYRAPPPPPPCRTWVVILIDGHWGRLKVSHFEPLLKSEDQDLLLLVWNLDRDGQRSLHCCKLYLHFQGQHLFCTSGNMHLPLQYFLVLCTSSSIYCICPSTFVPLILFPLLLLLVFMQSYFFFFFFSKLFFFFYFLFFCPPVRKERNVELPWISGGWEILCHSGCPLFESYWCNDPLSWTAEKTHTQTHTDIRHISKCQLTFDRGHTVTYQLL